MYDCNNIENGCWNYKRFLCICAISIEDSVHFCLKERLAFTVLKYRAEIIENN